MARLYDFVVKRPGWSVLVYITFLSLLWATPTFLVFRSESWDLAWDWARVVLQLGALLLALVGGTVALAQWHQVRSKRYEDRVQQIIDQKPVVFTDSLRDGSYEIRNLGSAYAFNVWLVVAAHEEPITLGSLDTHQARIVPEAVATILGQTEARAHILLAAARPVPLPPSERRPYTVTFNAQGTDGMFRHEYDRDPPKTRLVRDGTIQEYLGVEREDLLAKLAAFVAESEMAS